MGFASEGIPTKNSKNYRAEIRTDSEFWSYTISGPDLENFLCLFPTRMKVNSDRITENRKMECPKVAALQISMFNQEERTSKRILYDCVTETVICFWMRD